VSVTVSRVLAGRYVDSVLLMRLAQRFEALDGIEHAAAMMGTEANKKTLGQGGFLSEEASTAGANDLVVAVKAGDHASAAAALAQVEPLLAEHHEGGKPVSEARTLEQALEAHPELNLALISVPGEYAGAEARRALERGLHVMIFSSNVPLEEEVELKRLARDKGLLCMGPDCGTAIIGGVGLAFANAVRRGPVGVVGASGTGIQAVTSLLDHLGVGVSHAIGCGSRDLSEAVGAITALQALVALEADESTEAVLVLSKPPASAVAARIREWAARATKPVVCCFLGEPEGPQTLADAALAAARAVGQDVSAGDLALNPEIAAPTRKPLAPGQRYLRGLFAGGTLAHEAQLVLQSRGIDVFSNAPLSGDKALDDVSRSRDNTVLDLGSEELTRGRPHPMIDSRLRRERLLQEAADLEVAVILLDFVLGYGAAHDPAGDLTGAIMEAVAAAHKVGRQLYVVASVVGTEKDPQGLAAQEEKLRSAGVLVTNTSAQAAELAASLLPQSDRARTVQGVREDVMA
jgi:FdrA protein